jgi:hypothetical protein
MAEFLGVVASGIAVGQLASSVVSGVQKLRKIWLELQESPTTMLHLLEEVELYSMTLRDSESAFGHYFDAHPVGRDVSRRLREAVRDLNAVLGDVPHESIPMKRLKRGKANVKAILAKDRINTIEQRLGRLSRLFQLASQCALK